MTIEKPTENASARAIANAITSSGTDPGQPLQFELDRIARALDTLERAVTRREAEMAEMVTLRARHRRLKDTVSSELQQLDLLLANLPQKP